MMRPYAPWTTTALAAGLAGTLALVGCKDESSPPRVTPIPVDGYVPPSGPRGDGGASDAATGGDATTDGAAAVTVTGRLGDGVPTFGALVTAQACDVSTTGGPFCTTTDALGAFGATLASEADQVRVHVDVADHVPITLGVSAGDPRAGVPTGPVPLATTFDAWLVDLAVTRPASDGSVLVATQGIAGVSFALANASAPSYVGLSTVPDPMLAATDAAGLALFPSVTAGTPTLSFTTTGATCVPTTLAWAGSGGTVRVPVEAGRVTLVVLDCTITP